MLGPSVGDIFEPDPFACAGRIGEAPAAVIGFDQRVDAEVERVGDGMDVELGAGPGGGAEIGSGERRDLGRDRRLRRRPVAAEQAVAEPEQRRLSDPKAIT